MEKALYKFKVNFRRSGSLEGLFIAKKDDVKFLIEENIIVYFGEVLGKHSEIYFSIKNEEILFISDNPEVIDIFERYNLENGYNPFDYTALNYNRDGFEKNHFQDYTIKEIIEIINNEEAIL